MPPVLSRPSNTSALALQSNTHSGEIPKFRNHINPEKWAIPLDIVQSASFFCQCCGNKFTISRRDSAFRLVGLAGFDVEELGKNYAKCFACMNECNEEQCYCYNTVKKAQLDHMAFLKQAEAERGPNANDQLLLAPYGKLKINVGFCTELVIFCTCCKGLIKLQKFLKNQKFPWHNIPMSMRQIINTSAKCIKCVNTCYSHRTGTYASCNRCVADRRAFPTICHAVSPGRPGSNITIKTTLWDESTKIIHITQAVENVKSVCLFLFFLF